MDRSASISFLSRKYVCLTVTLLGRIGVAEQEEEHVQNETCTFFHASGHPLMVPELQESTWRPTLKREHIHPITPIKKPAAKQEGDGGSGAEGWLRSMHRSASVSFLSRKYVCLTVTLLRRIGVAEQEEEHVTNETCTFFSRERSSAHGSRTPRINVATNVNAGAHPTNHPN